LIERGCLAVSFCIEIYASRVVLIPCAPVVRVLRVFSPGAPAVFLRVAFAGYVTPCRILVVVVITPAPTSRGHRGTPAVTVGSAGSLCTVEGKPPGTRRKAKPGVWGLLRAVVAGS
jgi:hypothetical protein